MNGAMTEGLWKDYLRGEPANVSDPDPDAVAGYVELCDGGFFNVITDDYEGHAATDSARCRMAIAATALWDQPFGFTWDMVDILRDLQFPEGEFAKELRVSTVADAIERLLPPRVLLGAVADPK